MGFLDFVFGWVFNFHPALSILIVSFLISLLITVALKVFTDQKLMKDLKDELKELQKEMKTLRNNPNKLAKVNSQFMETNMKYMSQSMRPTLFTFLPILIIFGWLNSHIGYYPLLPGEPFEFTVYFDEVIDDTIYLEDLPPEISIFDEDFFEKKASWDLISETEGQYTLTVNYKDIQYTKDVLITTQRSYLPPEKILKKRSFLFSTYDENSAEKIIVGNEKVIPFFDVPILGEIPWIKTWGWLGTYIFFSLIFSMGLRKVFNVY